MEHTYTPENTGSYRRRIQIEDCLYENMLHTPYQSISVTDICRQVGISRKAFYNYYHDKDTCLRSIISRTIRGALLHITSNVPDNATPLEACVSLLEYWKSCRQYFDVIQRNGLFYLVLEENIRYILEEDKSLLDLLSTPEVKSDMDILCCYMASQQTLILQWYSRGFDTPTEEMARKYLRIMHLPMISSPED